MSRHEIITLQFGSFANFAGAHFWNIQVLYIRVQRRFAANWDGCGPSRLCNISLISPG